MVSVKSIALTFQEAGWLTIVVLIFAAVIAASSIVGAPRLKYLRHL